MRVYQLCLCLVLPMVAFTMPNPGRASAVALPPAAAASFPGTGALVNDQLSLQWRQQMAPQTSLHRLSLGSVEFECGVSRTECRVTVHGQLGGELNYDVPIYPYTVYSIEVQVDSSGADVLARVLLSGNEWWSGSLVGEKIAAVTDLEIVNYDVANHAFIGPLRLWSTATPDPWVFGEPEPATADLVGLWMSTAGATWSNATGGPDGILELGAAAHGQLCWRSPEAFIFYSGFESGAAGLWDMVNPGF